MASLAQVMSQLKRQTDRTQKHELPRSVGAQCATGDQWRNNSRKNEKMEPKRNKQKQNKTPIVDMTGAGSSLMLKRAILYRNLEY